MTRVPNARRELIAQPLLQSFDAAVATLVQKRGRMPRIGNWTTMLYSPEACQRIHHWGEHLLNESSLSYRIQQLAMLVVAREFDSQYIWISHAGKGKEAGLTAGLVDALRDRKPLPTIKPDENAVIKYGQEFYRTHRVSEETFQRAIGLFGAQGLVELTMLMGFYATLAFNLNAFDIDLSDQPAEPRLPM